MVQVTYRTDNDILYVAVSGRIDAAGAPDFEKEVFDIRAANKDKHTVIDADNLEYISSAGLRVILKIRKEEPDLAVINVSSGVYEVFEMTGFTDMLTIEKAYPKMSIDGCEFLAKGANGAVYRYDDETIIKYYFNKDALPEIKQERENARKAFVLGVNTAIPYGIVRVGEGYGTVTELLNATSISKLIRANPDDLTKAVEYFADTAKQLHSIRVEKGELPDYKDWVKSWVDFLVGHLPQELTDKLARLIDELPESEYMIHGDYHTNNIMVQNGEALLIDLDTLSVGCPVLELGSAYNAFIGFSELNQEPKNKFLDIDLDTSVKFWNMTLARYLGTEDEAVIRDVENKAKVIGYMRLLRRSIRRNKDEAVIDHYKEKLIEATNKVETLNF